MENFKSGRWLMNNLLHRAIRFKKQLVFALCLVGYTETYSQQSLRISQILDSIDRKHPVVNMYEADIRSMDEAAKGARSWMPPEVGAGFFMTPYNPQRWKK